MPLVSRPTFLIGGGAKKGGRKEGCREGVGQGLHACARRVRVLSHGAHECARECTCERVSVWWVCV